VLHADDDDGEFEKYIYENKQDVQYFINYFASTNHCGMQAEQQISRI